MADIHRYLDALLPPVLHCFDDPESRVRYYACESMYNIAKVARGHILKYFNQIFDGLCKLFADVDVDVKNGANLLDRLVKDIVTESESFDVERFIPLLQKYIRRTNPYIRQLLIGWITVLDSVPDINMLDWLPEFLDGLFNMLSDGNREIWQAADSALAEFLREIKESSVVEFGPMVSILVAQCSTAKRLNRLTAITWVQEFINLGGDRLLLFYSDILGAIMHCISDTDAEIRNVAGQTNQELLVLVNDTTKNFEVSSLLQTLTAELSSTHIPTRMAALRWINMLLEKLPEDMKRFIEELLPALLRTLSDDADEVVLMNLKVLARISLHDEQFRAVLIATVDLFASDRRLLETRGSLIVRKLCVLLDAKKIYISLAGILSTRDDLEFASLMVQTLNLILLTATELSALRDTLKHSFQPTANAEDRAVFSQLFMCWSHNPVATLSLCLLAQAYDLASSLVQRFAEVEITVGLLMQIDKLVQLLESPIFVQLRLQLLEVDAPYHPALLKSLYGLLMLLPQSTAFRTLSDRLATVSSLQQHLSTSGSRAAAAPSKKEKARTEDYQELLQQFERIQAKHGAAHHAAIDSRSLRAAKQPGTGAADPSKTSTK